MIKVPTMTRAAFAAIVLATATLSSPPAAAQSADTEADEMETGLAFEPEAVYRSFPATGTYRAFLPPSVDLSRFFPPVGFQGHQSSCVAWATSYGLRGYYENREHGGASSAATLSPAFIYNQIKGRTTNCQTFTSISDALNLMKRVGTVPMSEFPYDAANCTRMPDQGLLSEARSFRINDWKRVDTSRPDDVKGQLFAGNPVVVGMMVNQAFHRLRGDAVFEDGGTDGGGHAMVVVGYDDEKGAFKLFNSWGRGWADRGFGWVDYDTFKTRVHAAYVMQVPMGSAPTNQMPATQPRPRPQATNTVTPAPAPAPRPNAPRPPPAPEPAAETPEQRINALVADIPCSVLRAERGAGGRIAVRGVVGKPSDRDYVATLIGNETGIGKPSLDIAVMPWPQCEVRMTFAPALDRPQGLAIRIRSSAGPIAPNARPVLNEGSALVIDVTTPAFPSYLYVIYLQTGGEAVMVHTPAMTSGRPWPANSRVVVGDGSGGAPSLAIGEPYGDEMILAVAAPSPLTSTSLQVIMTEREFLSLFRRTLQGHGTRDISPVRADQAAAAYAVLTTKAGPR